MRASSQGSIALALTVLSLAARATAPPQEPPPPRSVEQLVADVLGRMKSHAYFSKILVSVDRAHEPIVLLLHKPQVETPNWAAAMTATHAPWLKKLEEVFRATYVEPLGWKRSPDAPAYFVCVLQTHGDYLNFSKSIQEHSYNWGTACYDRALRTTVVFQEALADVVPHQRRYYELAEFVRALLAAHYSGSDGKLAQAWIAEGLGAYLAFHLGFEPKVLEARRVDTEVLDLLLRLSQDKVARDVYLAPIAEFVGLRGMDEVEGWMQRNSKRAKLAKLDRGMAWYAFHAQSAAWMHFLHDADQGRHRARLMSFFTAAMAGDGGASAFKRAFDGVALAELDRLFYRWVYAQYQAAHGGAMPDVSWIDKLFVSRSGAVAAASAPTFDPREVAPPRDDVAAAHGAILQRVRRGELEAALAQLTELDARSRESAFARRVAADLERLKRLIALRDAHLAELVLTGGKLELEHEGKKVSAKVLRVENGVVHLDENRAKLASLPLSALDPFELARSTPKKLADGPDGWIRLYPYVLAGDARWKTLLKGDAPQVAELRNDALEWYPPLLELGHAAERMFALADAGAPADARAAEPCTQSIRELLERFGQLELVRGRSAALARLAAVAFDKQFEPAKLASWLAGEVELLEEGRVRISYSFDAAEEGLDFVLDASCMSAWHAALPPTLLAASESRLAVSDGCLRGNGAVSYRHMVALEAPLSARYWLRYGSAPEVGSSGIGVRFVLCDDGQGNYVACDNIGDLTVVDNPSALSRADRDEGGRTLDSSHCYELALVVDGKHATSFRDGVQVKQLPCGTRTRGTSAFGAHGDPGVAFERIVFEGRLALDDTRARWVAAQIAALGLTADAK